MRKKEKTQEHKNEKVTSMFLFERKFNVLKRRANLFSGGREVDSRAFVESS